MTYDQRTRTTERTAAKRQGKSTIRLTFLPRMRIQPNLFLLPQPVYLRFVQVLRRIVTLGTTPPFRSKMSNTHNSDLDLLMTSTAINAGLSSALAPHRKCIKERRKAPQSATCTATAESVY